jgi:hypothetical protein
MKIIYNTRALARGAPAVHVVMPIVHASRAGDSSRGSLSERAARRLGRHTRTRIAVTDETESGDL